MAIKEGGFFLVVAKAMSHPIVHTDSLQPGYIHSPKTSLVTVVTGHTSCDIMGEEVGWKLIHVCPDYWKTMRAGRRICGLAKSSRQRL